MDARWIGWEIETEEEMRSRETAAERQIEVLGIDITIVQDCELLPDMIKALAKKPLSMGKTPCWSLYAKGMSGWVSRIKRRKRGEKKAEEEGERE